MPTRKKAASTKKASAKSAGAKAVTGPVPPYGEAIRGAVARGDAQEMKDVAASARKWVSDVQAALKQLDTAVKKTRKR
jgi:uncharacterized protein DUF1843